MSLRMLAIAGIIGMTATGSAGLWAQSRQVGAAATSETAALRRFEEAIAKYVALREALVKEKIVGPVPNSSAPELNRASDALAAAIQRARAKAKPGDIFAAPVTTVFKQRVTDVVRSENLAPVLAGIDDELKGSITPTIHLRFPMAAPMATMPPSLLAALPRLPKSLEYRIIGQYLVLRDVEAALIIDFIPAVIPR
ncbi:MAG: hypothetical protein ABI039_08965 [Vicinamibacterales bacterium]